MLKVLLNSKNVFAISLFLVIGFSELVFAQVKVPIDFNKFLKPISFETANTSIFPTFVKDRIVVVNSIGPFANVGTGVFLGVYNYSFSSENSDFTKIQNSSDQNKYLVVATNYHVAGRSPISQVGFLNSALILIDGKACSSHRDICLLFISLDKAKLFQLPNSIISQPSLKMISAEAISLKSKLIYIGYIETQGYFSSEGSVDFKFSDKDYFLDASPVMLSTTAMFKQGMSGGAAINERGELIGLISVLNVIHDPSVVDYKNSPFVPGSFFLPTNWIQELLDQSELHQNQNRGVRTDIFWERDIPNFLRVLIEAN